jgi:hypothetical protein
MIAAQMPPGTLAQAQEDWFAQFQPVQASGPLTSSEGSGGLAGMGGTGTSQIDPSNQVQATVDQAASVPAPSSGGVSMADFSRAWEASPFPGTVEGLKQFLASNPAYAQAGITLGGSKGDKVYGPGGVFWGDAVQSAGLGGLGKNRLSGDAGGGSGGGLASLGLGFGSSMAPWTEQFQAPTAEQAMNSPGVQFGLDEAMRRMQNGAAAKGTLLNGRVQQAIGASNVGNAMQAYGDIYNRAQGEYGIRRENFWQNQDRPFSKNLSLAQLGKPT